MPASPKKIKQPMARAFDGFIVDEPSLEDARNKVVQFAFDLIADPFGTGYCLTLAGRSGTGKTLLAIMLLARLGLNAWGQCDAIPTELRGGRKLDFEAHLFDMRQVSDGFKNGRYSIVERMEEINLCILDDLGADHDPSKVTVSKVDRILRSRVRRWMLITVNLSLSDIADTMDPRIASFLVRDDNKFVEIQAKDFAKRRMGKG